MCLIPAVARAVSIPVIGAGGIGKEHDALVRIHDMMNRTLC